MSEAQFIGTTTTHIHFSNYKMSGNLTTFYRYSMACLCFNFASIHQEIESHLPGNVRTRHFFHDPFHSLFYLNFSWILSVFINFMHVAGFKINIMKAKEHYICNNHGRWLPCEHFDSEQAWKLWYVQT